MDSRYVVETEVLDCTVDRREPKKRARAREVLRCVGGFAVPLARDDWEAALRERLSPYTLPKYQFVIIYNTFHEAKRKARTGAETRERRQS
jgi:hypothetical protein